MTASNVENLYKNYEMLSDASDKKKHASQYEAILQAVKGSTNEKRLASQFITRFFKYFPELADKAIEAMLDLCEDEDVSIRKQAIKDMPSLAKESHDHLPKIADVLAQMLQSDDTSELSVVHSSLLSLLRTDAKGTLTGLFSQILAAEEDVVRERSLKFLATRISLLAEPRKSDTNGAEAANTDSVTSPGKGLDPSVEEFILHETRKVLIDVTADEFFLLLGTLSQLQMARTSQGQKKILELLGEKAEIGKAFDPSDAEAVDQLVQCLKHSVPYFSALVSSGGFVSHVCLNVLPGFNQISDSDTQLDILKLLAEMSLHAGKLEEPRASVEAVLQVLIEEMPLPATDAMDENTEEPEMRLNFSFVECLLFSFHQLGRQCPDLLTENPDLLKDFRLRLQYVARGTQGYIRRLRAALQGKAGEELRSDENKVKVVALKTTSNINALVRDLFHSPPAFKVVLSLSWKPISSSHPAKKVTAGMKRALPDDQDGSNKQLKSERVIYQPPSGKFSAKAGSYVPSRRGRGAFRGGWRGGWRRRNFSAQL